MEDRRQQRRDERSREHDPRRPSVPGYNKYVLDINGVKLNGTGSGDPVKAAAMLKAAGKENFELVWYYSNDSKIATAGSAYREKFFQKAGFKTKAIGVPKAQIRSYGGLHQGRQRPLVAQWLVLRLAFPVARGSGALQEQLGQEQPVDR